MCRRGRSFAAGALLMLVAQFTLVCATPLAACAVASQAADVAQGDEVDCCPAGSHAPGQCPLHRKQASSGNCRLTCANAGRTPFIPGVAGVLSPSVVLAPVVLSQPAISSPEPARIFCSLSPGSPPPKHLL